MGFLSNLKNTLTGGWADVALTTGEARRGAPLDVAVNVGVRSEDIKVNEVYVVLQCREIVRIEGHRTGDRDEDGDLDTVDVRKDVELFERRFRLAHGLSLDANSEHVYETAIEVPEHLPPSFRGRNARIRWRILAALDMRGNDPDSAWQELHVH